MTFGHEVAGIVQAVGPEVTSVKPGQQVLVFPWIGCGECDACNEDRESDCAAMRIIGLKQKGGFATHCLVENDKFLVDIDGLDAADVVPHACSGITVFNALEKMGALRSDEWMAIMGCGGLGMNAISIARAMSFNNIIAVDIDNGKLEAALEMGATKVLNSKKDDAVSELKKLAEGRLMGARHLWRSRNWTFSSAGSLKSWTLSVSGPSWRRLSNASGLAATKSNDRPWKPCWKLTTIAQNYRFGPSRKNQANADRQTTTFQD